MRCAAKLGPVHYCLRAFAENDLLVKQLAALRLGVVRPRPIADIAGRARFGFTGGFMTIYQRLRIWVDEIQSGGLHAGKLLYVAGTFPLFATPLFGNWWRIPGVAIAVGWMAFLLWRLWLMAKTGLVASDVPQGRLIEKTETVPTGEAISNGS